MYYKVTKYCFLNDIGKRSQYKTQFITKKLRWVGWFNYFYSSVFRFVNWFKMTESSQLSHTKITNVYSY